MAFGGVVFLPRGPQSSFKDSSTPAPWGLASTSAKTPFPGSEAQAWEHPSKGPPPTRAGRPTPPIQLFESSLALSPASLLPPPSSSESRPAPPLFLPALHSAFLPIHPHPGRAQHSGPGAKPPPVPPSLSAHPLPGGHAPPFLLGRFLRDLADCLPAAFSPHLRPPFGRLILSFSPPLHPHLQSVCPSAAPPSGRDPACRRPPGLLRRRRQLWSGEQRRVGADPPNPLPAAAATRTRATESHRLACRGRKLVGTFSPGHGTVMHVVART